MKNDVYQVGSGW